jgi:hypothetical protein
MPVVKVRTAKYCTVPKSASVSISASATPPTMAGRASGRASRRKHRGREWPRVREASTRHTLCCWKAPRQSRNT